MSRAPTMPPNRRSAGISAVRTADAIGSAPYQMRSTQARLSMRMLLRRLEKHPHAFGFFRSRGVARVVRGNVHGIAVCERHTRERTRNHESIPTLETPRRRRGDDGRYDWRAGALRDDERSWRE